jgi:predicted Zn-dependent protease
MNALTQDDSQHSFEDYISDAKKRLEHDQQSPDEPKQIQPGENVTNADNRIQVSGQVAVMAINQRLLQSLMQKNPDLTFAMQESFAMKDLYTDAAPLGPIMELRAQDGQSAFTKDRASESLDYWQTAAQNLLADPEATGSDEVRKLWSKDADSAGNLLASHNYNDQAEQIYRLAAQLCPYSPESATNLAELLARTGRPEEARQVLDNFARNYPNQSAAIENARASAKIIMSSKSAQPGP